MYLRAVDEHGAELVVFGGDLNLRDREAKAVATQLSNAGGCPLDVWEVKLFSFPALSYTSLPVYEHFHYLGTR